MIKFGPTDLREVMKMGAESCSDPKNACADVMEQAQRLQIS